MLRRISASGWTICSVATGGGISTRKHIDRRAPDRAGTVADLRRRRGHHPRGRACAGKGWPTIFLLALAYAAIEEGLVCQTLFDPSYYGFELLREAYIPFLGMGMWWTLFVLTLHTIWSISVPIAIVESLIPERATTPWLGRPGLAVVLVLYVLGCVLIFSGTYRQEQFMATTTQRLGITAFTIALIAAAFRVGQQKIHSDRTVPSPWQVGAFSFLISSLFMGARYVSDGLADRLRLPFTFWNRRGLDRALVRPPALGCGSPTGTRGRGRAGLCLAFLPGETGDRRRWDDRSGRECHILDRSGDAPRRGQPNGSSCERRPSGRARATPNRRDQCRKPETVSSTLFHLQEITDLRARFIPGTQPRSGIS